MVGKMSKIDSYQHRGSELRNTAPCAAECGSWNATMEAARQLKIWR